MGALAAGARWSPATGSRPSSAAAAWASSTARAQLALDRIVALKVIAPGAARGRRRPRALPARGAGRGVDRSPERDPGLRRRARTTASRSSRCATSPGDDLRALVRRARAAASRSAAAEHRRAGRRGAGRDPPRRASCTATSSPRTCCSTASDHVYLTDFGLAKQVLTHGGRDRAPATGSGRSTTSRPSRSAAGAIDARADVYALGGVLLLRADRPRAVRARGRRGEAVGAAVRRRRRCRRLRRGLPRGASTASSRGRWPRTPERPLPVGRATSAARRARPLPGARRREPERMVARGRRRARRGAGRAPAPPPGRRRVTRRLPRRGAAADGAGVALRRGRGRAGRRGGGDRRPGRRGDALAERGAAAAHADADAGVRASDARSRRRRIARTASSSPAATVWVTSSRPPHVERDRCRHRPQARAASGSAAARRASSATADDVWVARQAGARELVAHRRPHRPRIAERLQRRAARRTRSRSASASLWVAVTSDRARSGTQILALRPRRRASVDARRAATASPALATGSGRVWVAGARAARASLRLDPRARQAAAWATLAAAIGRTLAVGGGYLWATLGDGGPASPASTRGAQQRRPTSAGHRPAARGRGRRPALRRPATSTTASRSSTRAREPVGTPIEVPHNPYAIAADDGAVWVTGAGREHARRGSPTADRRARSAARRRARRASGSAAGPRAPNRSNSAVSVPLTVVDARSQLVGDLLVGGGRGVAGAASGRQSAVEHPPLRRR